VATAKGVPVGTQPAWLSASSRAWPLDVSLVDAVDQVALTHVPFPLGGGGKGQPATVYGTATVTVGCRLTVTRGLEMVGVATPKWAHCTVAPWWSRNPGMMLSFPAVR
jgi:hypothetical protein